MNINKKITHVNKKKRKKREKFLFLDQRFWKLYKYFASQGDSFCLILLSLLVLKGKRNAVSVHRNVLAYMAGVCETTVSRVIDKLYEAGLLTVHQHRTSNGHLHNTYVLSNVFKLEIVKRKIFSAFKYSLSEYVTLLKDSLLTLYKNIKILVSKIRYNYRKERHILQRDTHCILRE